MKMLIVCIMAILFVNNANAKFEVKDVFLNIENDGNFNLNIVTDDEINQKPDLVVRDNLIQVEFEDAIVWPKINKNIELNGEKLEVNVYQFNKKIVRLRITALNRKNIVVSNSNVKINKKVLSYSGLIENPDLASNKIGNYDESYLNKLIEEREVISQKVSLDEKNIKEKIKPNGQQEDSVTLSYSSPEKKRTNSNFNIWGYAAKFIGFLMLMVGGIYAAFYLLKKGALKKNKLGFLNTDKQIEVITKHYLSPKRNLCLIKVQNQVFLIANHEHGIEFLSEINEPGKVLQNVEMEVVGDNFTQNLGAQKNSTTDFKIKEDINFSHPVNDEEDSITKKLRNKLRASRDVQ